MSQDDFRELNDSYSLHWRGQTYTVWKLPKQLSPQVVEPSKSMWARCIQPFTSLRKMDSSCLKNERLIVEEKQGGSTTALLLKGKTQSLKSKHSGNAWKTDRQKAEGNGSCSPNLSKATFVSRYIALFVASFFPPKKRKAWLDDMHENNGEMILQETPRWLMNCHNFLSVLGWLFRLVQIQSSDIVDFLKYTVTFLK